MTALLGIRPLAELLGVTSNQVYMWHQRRRTTGFPSAVASTLVPQFPGDKKRSPLFDVDQVVDWASTYDPNKRRGRHFNEKRNGKPPLDRHRKHQERWHERHGRRP